MFDVSKFPEHITDVKELGYMYTALRRSSVAAELEFQEKEVQLATLRRQTLDLEKQKQGEMNSHAIICREMQEKFMKKTEEASKFSWEVSKLKDKLEDAQTALEKGKKRMGELEEKMRDKDSTIKGLSERITFLEGFTKDARSLEAALEAEKKAHADVRIRIDKLASRLTQEKSTTQELRKSVQEGDQRFAAQYATMVAPETHRAELDVKDARILELERLLHESYRARTAGDAVQEGEDDTAVYISTLKKEVAHLQGMVRTSKERETHLTKSMEAKNLRMDTLDYQVARYEELLAGQGLPAEVRRWLDPQIVVDTMKLMKRVRRGL